MAYIRYALCFALFLLSIDIVFSLPDLYVQSVTVNPDPPRSGYEATLTATVKNIGPDVAPSSFQGQFKINGIDYGSPVQFQQGLQPGSIFLGQRIWVPQQSGPFDIGFFVDTQQWVTESDESDNSNYREINVNVFTQNPDIIVTDIEWDPEEPEAGDDVTLRATIKNNGTSPLVGAFWVNFYVDGNPLPGSTSEVYGPILVGKSVVVTASWTPPEDGDYSIRVWADSFDYITEMNEANNDRTETANVDPAQEVPDLVVTDVWHDGATIRCQVLNRGNAMAPGGIPVALSIDADLVETRPLPNTLAPGARCYLTFLFQWGCGQGSRDVGVCADLPNLLPELNETNNCREETWKCDETPPRITKGPWISTTAKSATISWETDESSDSTVRIDDRKPVLSRSVSDDKLVTYHTIRVDDLRPFRGYAFYVKSTDGSKNSVESRTYPFFTDPEADEKDPDLEIDGDAVLRGISMFSVDASDDKGVRRIDFFIDGLFHCSDYSYPYECPVDTTMMSNGVHTVTARVFDFIGNSRSDNMQFDVNNLLPGMDAPSIGVYSPRRDETIVGSYLVNITAYDADGMHTVEVFMEGERIYSVSAPNVLTSSTVIPGRGMTSTEFKESLTRIYPRLNITFLMDTLDWDNGDYNFTVRGWDLNGNTTQHFIPITIFNPFPRNHPDLLITRPDTTFDPPGLSVKLRVTNRGTRRATGIVLQDVLHGFYPTGISSPFGVSVEGRLGVLGGTFTTSFAYAEIRVPDLDPGVSMLLSYQVMPYLHEFFPQHRSIGGSTRVDYNGTQGDSYGEFIGVPCGIVHINLGSGITMDVALSSFVGALLMEMDYLIVTCPANMPILGTDGEIGRLVQSMARLAYARDGTIGFLESAPADVLRERLCELIWDGGGWSGQLASDYPSRGYLLIVGETEIIPSWYHGPFNIKWEGSHRKDVENCDTDYGDSNGNWRPEIMVGRIIGNTAVQLQAPIDASIRVAEGTSTFDRSKALLISGDGNNFDTFVDDIDDVAGELRGEYAFVDKIHMTEHFIIDDFHHEYTRYDGMAVGNVLGGSDNEIILARDDDERVFVYNPTGVLLADYPLSGFDDDCVFRINERVAGLDYISFYDPGDDSVETSMVDGLNHGAAYLTEFSGYYDFDVGNVDTDGRNEYVIASAEEDRVFIHDSASDTSFFFDFTNHDRMVVGDVQGDSRDEIIIARNDDNTIFVFDETGALLSSFTSSDEEIFTRYDRLAVGDVIGDGKEEILVARDDDKTVHVYSSGGWEWGEVYLWFTRYDKIAVGDVLGGPKCEIIMAKDDDTQIYIADMEWENRIRDDISSAMINSDLIHWFGHGNIDNWGCFSTTDVPGGFGGATPVVFTVTCLAGDYEGGDDSNIAEKFLENGAAVYIGSTMVSPNSLNDYASNKLFDNWIDTERTLGQAFKETEKDVRNRYTSDYHGSFGKFWVAEYNYYGDPKYGKLGGISSLSSVGDEPEPQTRMMVEVPDLVITHDGENDLVSLPGGTPNVRVGDPQIPAYTTTLMVPMGWRVANVSMLSRSQPEIFENINIPPTAVYVDGERLGTPASNYQEGWYPGTDYYWEVIEEAVMQELVVTVFPASYNALIAQLMFFNRYEFQIDYLESPLEIVDAYMDSYTYKAGEEITVEVEIASDSEEEIWTILEGTIRPCMENIPIGGAGLRQIDVIGRTFVSVKWSVVQFEEGGYVLDLVLRDDRGNPLGSRTVRFWVGSLPANITSISVSPESTFPGSSVDVSMSLQNAGDMPADGRAWIWVYDSEGRRVFESMNNLTTILPNTVISFSESVDLAGMYPGTYDVRGFVMLNGQLLESRSASFRVGDGILVLILLQAFAVLGLRRTSS